ncbi:unnamed protein product, partial [Effrenium voratum]
VTATSCGCAFYDGATWREEGEDGVSRAPAEPEPGWDFFQLRGFQGPSLQLRRAAAIRLVRVYSHWPSSDPLATALHPAGVKELQLELPAPVRELPSLIVAVCPSELALRGDRADRSQPRVSSRKFTAAAAAVAAAESEAEAAELEARAGALFGLRKTCASPSSSAPTRSTASNTPRLEGLDAAGVLTRLYEEEVLAAFRAGTGPGQEELEEVTGVREKNDEIASVKRELELERAAREVAEAASGQAAAEIARLQEQCGALQQKLRASERSRMAAEMQIRQLSADLDKAAYAAPQKAAPKSLDEVVSGLVALEARDLRGVESAEKALLKRKLLLRWHPDKNSAGNGGASELAKRITQELQAHPEWN